MKRYAQIIITKDDNGHLTAKIDADISTQDILLGFALLTQNILQGKIQNKGTDKLPSFTANSIDERLSRK